MALLIQVLFSLAFALTLLAGLNVTGSPKLHLGWLGVAALVLALTLLNWPGAR